MVRLGGQRPSPLAPGTWHRRPTARAPSSTRLGTLASPRRLTLLRGSTAAVPQPSHIHKAVALFRGIYCIYLIAVRKAASDFRVEDLDQNCLAVGNRCVYIFPFPVILCVVPWKTSADPRLSLVDHLDRLLCFCLRNTAPAASVPPGLLWPSRFIHTRLASSSGTNS